MITCTILNFYRDGAVCDYKYKNTVNGNKEKKIHTVNLNVIFILGLTF